MARLLKLIKVGCQHCPPTFSAQPKVKMRPHRTEFKPVMELSGPWEVCFDREWFYSGDVGEALGNDSGPIEVGFDQLEDWSRRPEAAVKYYSGSAIYRKSFILKELKSSDSGIMLDLGNVEVIARVKLNGRDLGVLWTKPFRVDATDAVKAGENELEVDVANLWPNRLTGDTFLPREKRRTRTNMTKYTQSSELLPSGLLGPVRFMEESCTEESLNLNN